MTLPKQLQAKPSGKELLISCKDYPAIKGRLVPLKDKAEGQKFVEACIRSYAGNLIDNHKEGDEKTLQRCLDSFKAATSRSDASFSGLYRLPMVSAAEVSMIQSRVGYKTTGKGALGWEYKFNGLSLGEQKLSWEFAEKVEH